MSWIDLSFAWTSSLSLSRWWSLKRMDSFDPLASSTTYLSTSVVTSSALPRTHSSSCPPRDCSASSLVSTEAGTLSSYAWRIASFLHSLHLLHHSYLFFWPSLFHFLKWMSRYGFCWLSIMSHRRLSIGPLIPTISSVDSELFCYWPEFIWFKCNLYSPYFAIFVLLLYFKIN